MTITQSQMAALAPQLNSTEFRLLGRLIHEWSGITLGESKEPLLRARLGKRLRALGLKSFMEYYELVAAQGVAGAESIEMLDAISTNLTQFFREPAHFDYLKRSFFARWRGETCIRMLSAGCSSGEEPYSIAICAREALADEAIKVQITAGDISERSLALARTGIYPQQSVRAVPLERLKMFFLKGAGRNEGLVSVAPELRNMVAFQRLNLAERLPFTLRFHAIFCRNVAIYFDRQAQLRLIARFCDALLPRGVLFLGHSESILTDNRQFAYIQPTVYERRNRMGSGAGDKNE